MRDALGKYDVSYPGLDAAWLANYERKRSGGMTAETLSLKRPRKPFPIPASACSVLELLGSDSALTMRGATYRLSHVREGTQIFFNVPTAAGHSFTWNLSTMHNVWPPTFAGARKWVKSYAARYGQTVEERRKERMTSPTGEDRKALKAGRCKEAWLSSDVPALFAEAMIRCHHAGAFCAADGYCHYGTCKMEMMQDVAA